jgi:hypothetical protein
MSRELVTPREPLGKSKWVYIRGCKILMYERDWKRFLSNTAQHPETGCWDWTGYRWGRNMRPAFGGVGGAQTTASHIAYAWKNGEVPINREVCHTCDNENCVNPNHLWLGSHKENMRDMWRKGRGVDGFSVLRERGAIDHSLNSRKGWETRRRNAAKEN